MNRTVKLGDVAEFTNGGAWKADEYADSGVSVVRVSDIHDGTINLTDCKYLSAESFERYKKHELHAEDLVITTVGSHPNQPGSVVGRAAIVPTIADGALLNQNAVRITPSSDFLDKTYLGYLGQSSLFRNYIIQHARGSANQVRMSITLLKEMQFFLPDIQIQEKAASVLSAYDNLIENNTRRIRVLESLAQLIYREWFINFRFPGHEDVEMVDSELGLVPEGWEVKRIADFGTVVTGKTPSKQNPEYFSDDIPFIKTPDMHDNIFCVEVADGLSKLGADSQKNKYLAPNSILVNCIGALAGSVAINPVTSQTNQQINALVLDNLCFREFAYFSLLNLRDEIRLKGSTGATMLNLSKGKFENLKVLVPPTHLIGKFYALAKPQFDLIKNLQIKNTTLRRTRDMLLPKLISGELDVSSLTILEEVAERNEVGAL